MKNIMLLTLLCSPASARVFTYADKGDPAGVEKALQAASFAVQSSVCQKGVCSLYLDDSEAKDPAPIIAAFVPPPTRAQNNSVVVTLVTALRAGTATQAQKDQLLALLVLMLLWK